MGMEESYEGMPLSSSHPVGVGGWERRRSSIAREEEQESRLNVIIAAINRMSIPCARFMIIGSIA
jgi:hypothetical protein